MVTLCPRCERPYEEETESTIEEMIKADREGNLLGAWTKVYFVTNDDLDDRKFFQLDAVLTSQMLGIFQVSQGLTTTARDENE